MILTVEPSGTLALTQQMDKFRDLGTPNHSQSHNQAHSPNNNQHMLSQPNDAVIHNESEDHVMNPFATGVYRGVHHGQTYQQTLHSSASSSILSPLSTSPSPGAAAPHHFHNTTLSASPSSSFSSPHLMRRPSSPTDSDQPVVSARNILARKISESPIDRNLSSVMCNGDSSRLTMGPPNNLNFTNAENPSQNITYEHHGCNKYDDEEMD